MSVLKEYNDKLWELISFGHIIMRQHKEFGALDTPAMALFKRQVEKFLIAFIVAWELDASGFVPDPEPTKDPVVAKVDGLTERLKKRFDRT